MTKLAKYVKVGFGVFFMLLGAIGLGFLFKIGLDFTNLTNVFFFVGSVFLIAIGFVLFFLEEW